MPCQLWCPPLQTVAANRFELQIVALSSSLSLNVIGTFKEMVTIGFSVLIFGDPINVRPTIIAGIWVAFFQSFSNDRANRRSTASA